MSWHTGCSCAARFLNFPSFTAGTTITMAVLYGKLLTVANVGDSKAFMDTGSEIVELSTSHRIEDNIGIFCTFSLDC